MLITSMRPKLWAIKDWQVWASTQIFAIYCNSIMWLWTILLYLDLSLNFTKWQNWLQESWCRLVAQIIYRIEPLNKKCSRFMSLLLFGLFFASFNSHLFCLTTAILAHSYICTQLWLLFKLSHQIIFKRVKYILTS